MVQRPFLRLCALVAVATTLLVWVARAQPQAPRRVFDDAPASSLLQARGDQGPPGRRVRPRVDDFLRAGQDRAEIQVPLRPGVDVVAAIAVSEVQSGGVFIAGPVVRTSVPGSSVAGEVALTMMDGRVAGRVVIDGQLFSIRPESGGGGWHRVEAMDPTDFLPDGHPLEVPAAEVPPAGSRLVGSFDLAGDSAAFVDLLLVYTPAARTAVGGTAAAQLEVQAAVNQANLALQNSGVAHRYRIAYNGEVSYTESGSSNTDLSRLRLVGDGMLDEVHALRDQYQADVVVLLTEASDVCGLGYVMGPSSVSSAFHPFAFNVTVLRGCAASNLSLAHEIGHNIGLQHDRENAGSLPAFDFAYGYRVPNVARTVMAYACATGQSCARRSIFSTPHVAFPGTSTAAGTTTEDNVRAMNLTAFAAANFRDSTCSFTVTPSQTSFPLSGGTSTVAVSAAAGCGWSAVSADPAAVAIVAPGPGAGSGTVSFTVLSSSVSRSTTLTVAGQSVVVTQGAALTVSIPSQTLFAAKGHATAPLQAYTPQQRVVVTIATPDARPWTATSDQPWLQVVNGTGAGSGSFFIRIANPDNVIGGASELMATVTVTADGLTPQAWPFTLRVSPLAESGGPFGSLDTPIGATTVSGAVPVTGWALGSEDITRVDIWRDAIAGLDSPTSMQPNGWVYIGQATQIAGARPDVAAAFPTYPQRHRAGWGHMVLTNALPHRTLATLSGGQGVFRLHVTATQRNAVQMQVGEVEITVDNDAATRPFGTIDTPAQGGIASSLVANFGWVLARGAAIVPPDGSTMVVFIDGRPVGRPVYDQCRGSNLAGGGSSFLPPGGTCDDDIATLFAAAGHQNIAPGSGRGAIGAYVFDTRTMSDGAHTMAWSVTDSLGRLEGIGSRIFSVSNGMGADYAEWFAEQRLAVTEFIRARRVEPRVVQARRGFDLATSFEVIAGDGAGVRHLRVRELDRVEIDLGGPVLAGYLARGDALVALPAGATLDARTGRFAWAPAAGFLGRFDVEFLIGDGRVPVSIEIVPQTLGPEHDGVRMHIDHGGPVMAGWALDPGAWHGAGIGAVHVWAQPTAPGSAPVFLGAAQLGGSRPDVATAFGPQFDRAGWSLTVPPLEALGDVVVTVYVWSSRTGRWEDARTVGRPRR